MSKHSTRITPALLLLSLLTNPCFAQSTSLKVGRITLQIMEREGSQSDKLLIKSSDQSLAIDLNRSVGVRGAAHLTSDGILIAGPYVLDTRQGELIRQSPSGYLAASPQLDAHIHGMQIDLRAGARHWHCSLPLPPIEPRGISTYPVETSTRSAQSLLVFGAQKDTESGITTIRPMTLKLPGCRLRQAKTILEFDHGMVVPQASHGGWWTYSVSEPKLALSTDGINWRYPALPVNVRSLLTAFLDDQGVAWIAVSMTGNDAIQLFRQPARSKDWLPIQEDETKLPIAWLEGRLLLTSDLQP